MNMNVIYCQLRRRCRRDGDRSAMGRRSSAVRFAQARVPTRYEAAATCSPHSPEVYHPMLIAFLMLLGATLPALVQPPAGSQRPAPPPNNPRQAAAGVCTFDRGDTKIYLNGKLAVSRSNIAYTTDDATAPGRLGLVNDIYDAVNDVIVATEPSTMPRRYRNCVGTLGEIRILNHLQERIR